MLSLGKRASIAKSTFIDVNKTNFTEICNVDLLLLVGNSLFLIDEISHVADECQTLFTTVA